MCPGLTKLHLSNLVRRPSGHQTTEAGVTPGKARERRQVKGETGQNEAKLGFPGSRGPSRRRIPAKCWPRFCPARRLRLSLGWAPGHPGRATRRPAALHPRIHDRRAAYIIFAIPPARQRSVRKRHRHHLPALLDLAIAFLYAGISATWLALSLSLPFHDYANSITFIDRLTDSLFRNGV